MKKLVFFLILAVAFAGFVGCVGIDSGSIPLPNACDQAKGPSLLCEMAAEQGVNLSVVADGLGLANIIAIEKGLYTKGQALEVLAGMRAFMESPVSYAAFKAELGGVIEEYPYLLQTADRYVSQLTSTQIMYAEDRRLITGWIDRLIAGLG